LELIVIKKNLIMNRLNNCQI